MTDAEVNVMNKQAEAMKLLTQVYPLSHGVTVISPAFPNGLGLGEIINAIIVLIAAKVV